MSVIDGKAVTPPTVPIQLKELKDREEREADACGGAEKRGDLDIDPPRR